MMYINMWLKFWGVKPNKSKQIAISEGYEKFLKLLDDYSLPKYYNDYGKIPTDAELEREIDEFPSDELSDDDLFKMLKNCLK